MSPSKMTEEHELRIQLTEMTRRGDEWHEAYSDQISENIHIRKDILKISDDLQAVRKQAGDSRLYATALAEKLSASEAREIALRGSLDKISAPYKLFLDQREVENEVYCRQKIAEDALATQDPPPLLGVLREVEKVLETIAIWDGVGNNWSQGDLTLILKERGTLAREALAKLRAMVGEAK